jgi:Mrp family chromosome partitioning ATPase
VALARSVDRVLLVADVGETRRATESLVQVRANLLGVVLNRVPICGSGGYYHCREYHE